MEFANQAIGFFLGLISSWVFLYLLILIKPKIGISSVIVFNPNTGALLVKVRNLRRRQATDIHTSLSLVERKSDGRLFTLQSAKLRRDNLLALAPIQDLKKEWQLLSTFVFATDEGQEMLEKLTYPSNGEKRLVFMLSTTDAISGTKNVQQVTYCLEDVKNGKFGLGFDIIEHTEENNSERMNGADDE